MTTIAASETKSTSITVIASGTESSGGPGQQEFVNGTASERLVEYRGRKVIAGRPYDARRMVSVGTAENSEVIENVTVEDAINLVRSPDSQMRLNRAHQTAERFARELLACLKKGRSTGMLGLSGSPIYSTHFFRKKQEAIETDVINLVKKRDGLEAIDVEDVVLVKEVEAIAWRHVKTHELPGFVWSGTFLKRNNASLSKASGLMCVDFDKLAGAVDDFMKRMRRDWLIFWATRSPSGTGVKVLVRIPDDAARDERKYLACFETFERYVAEYYPGVSLSVDKQAKAIAQLCFYTHDAACLDMTLEGHVLLPDDDLLVMHQADAASKKKTKEKAKILKGEAQKPPEDHTSLPQPKEPKEGRPMEGWPATKQWETIRDAVESLLPYADGLGEGVGERNALWTRLGYSIGSWAKNVEDEAVVDEAREKVKEWEATHYGGSGGCVLRAFNTPNGSVSLGTLFELAKAHGDWVAPWRREGIKVNRPKVVGVDGGRDGGKDTLTPEERLALCREKAERYKVWTPSEMVDVVLDPADDLLGHHYLRRGGGLLVCAPTGVGKSSFEAQTGICWSVGREAFGIKPARALKILTIQAEDDDADGKEIMTGIRSGLELTTDEIKLADQNCLYVQCNDCTGTALLLALEGWLDIHRPDLVRLNPLNTYLGCSPNDLDQITPFLRHLLNPLLTKYRCGFAGVHHTTKTVNRDTSKWRPADWVYAYAGGAEFANWARAVIAIDATDDPTVFKFYAAKRGKRLEWGGDDDKVVLMRYFKHSPKQIFWVEADEEDIQNVERMAKEKKHGGPERKFDNGALFKVLLSAEQPLSRGQWYAEVVKQRPMGAYDRKTGECISQAAFYRRVAEMLAAGKVMELDDCLTPAM